MMMLLQCKAPTSGRSDRAQRSGGDTRWHGLAQLGWLFGALAIGCSGDASAPDTANGAQSSDSVGNSSGGTQGTASGGTQATASGGTQGTASGGTQATASGGTQGPAGGSTQGTASGGTQGTASGGTQGTSASQGSGTGGTASDAGASGAAGASSIPPVAYADCLEGAGGCPANDPMCVDQDGTVSTVTGAGQTSQRFEVCTRSCESDSDCPTDVESEAHPRCVEHDGMNVCMLDCSGGVACPEGMVCGRHGQFCMFSRYCECSDYCVLDPSSTVTCSGDCFGQRDVTCTRGCEPSEYNCVANEQ